MKIRFCVQFATFLVLFTFGLIIPPVQAQHYPNRPIQLILPTQPGTPSDLTGRLLAEELGKILGTQLIPMNKPGASMTLGTDLVVRSKKDGYTIGYTTTSAIVYARVSNPEAVPYDPIKDLEPLGLPLFFPLAVTVQESSPWKTFADLVDSAKKNPGKLRLSTHGEGSIDHFNLEIYQSLTGAQFTHVPLKGPQLATSLLGGHVEVISDAFMNVKPHAQAGKLRILLMTKKMPEFPDVPTLSELGYRQDLLSPWFAFYAPVGVPEEVSKVLVSAIEKAIKNPELISKFLKMGFIVDYKSPAELRKLAIEDYERAYGLAVKLGLRK
jgi:tripartite-type tricarboxylate transporter receptor subunit TctC